MGLPSGCNAEVCNWEQRTQKPWGKSCFWGWTHKLQRKAGIQLGVLMLELEAAETAALPSTNMLVERWHGR